MTRSISTVCNGTLHEHAEDASSIDALAVESAAWYAWLESHHSFRFEHPDSPFTARKEQRSGGWYWYAYRRQGGRLRTAYLGRSTELSLTRLNTIAAALGETGEKTAWQRAVEGHAPNLHAPHTSQLVYDLAYEPKIAPAHPFSERLTPRELDVLRLLAQGLTSARIAERLVIGVVTVNFHVRSLYSKLGVTSRAAATRYAIEYHLV